MKLASQQTQRFLASPTCHVILLHMLEWQTEAKLRWHAVPAGN